MKELEIDYKFRWRILSLFSHKKMLPLLTLVLTPQQRRLAGVLGIAAEGQDRL